MEKPDDQQQATVPSFISLSRVCCQLETRADVAAKRTEHIDAECRVIRTDQGCIANQLGLSAARFGLAGSLSLLIPFLFWKSRRPFPLDRLAP
jgi:hypothetical protein